jgi:1-acyl-sn-glycerol-3-phosphate acyltransferase
VRSDIGRSSPAEPACLHEVVRIVQAFAAELHHPRRAPAVTGGSHLERDLGIYSLERLELLLRLEEAFATPLGDAAAGAEYVHDLACLVDGGPAASRRAAPAAETHEHAVDSGPGSLAFSVYAAAVVLFAGSIVWLLLLVLPGDRLPVRLLRRVCRAVLRAGGCRLQVRGLEHLEEPALFVANHQSYIDCAVLVAALPIDLKIVVNERLPRWPLIGTIIRSARHVVVDRRAGDPRASCAAMTDALREGRSLLVFPEGTFADRAELLPFRLGGFSAAASAQRPVIPVALSGSRRILPDARRLLARGPLVVVIHPAVHPRGHGWRETLRLREEARACIARTLDTACKPPGLP